MGVAPGRVVTAPPAAPPRVGLIVSANTPTGEGTRWQGGIVYDPETGQAGYRADLCEPDAEGRALVDPAGVVEWQPYAVGDGYRCTALAAQRIDWRARVRRMVEAVAEYQVSRELWSGELARDHGYPNRYLAGPGSVDVTGGTAADPRDALACLEAYLAEAARGQRGMIHAPRAVVSRWAQDGGLRRDGGLILTIHDTIVVPGAGYDARGPWDPQAGESGAHAAGVWAYATGMVDVRRGEVDIFGDPQGDGAIDRDTNLVELRGEQAALASWDGIAHGAVELDVDECTTS